MTTTAVAAVSESPTSVAVSDEASAPRRANEPFVPTVLVTLLVVETVWFAMLAYGVLALLAALGSF